MLKIKLIFIFFVIFLNNALGSEIYLKCDEKISEIRIDNNSTFELGKILETSLVEINPNSKNPKITIYSKMKKNNKDKNFVNIIYEQEAKRSSLGFNIFIKNYNNNNDLELFYDFVKFDNFYGLTKKAYKWSTNTSSAKINKYDYTAVSRCEKKNKKSFFSILENSGVNFNIDYKWNGKLVSKEIYCNNALKANMPKYYPEKYKIKCENNFADKNINKIIERNNEIIQGTRSFALSWEGYDELIIGTLKFNEKDLIGKIEFNLSKNNPCFGTYVLSESKGTWSLLCEKNQINASGFLKWDRQTGYVSGNGKDEKNNKIKFKILE